LLRIDFDNWQAQAKQFVLAKLINCTQRSSLPLVERRGSKKSFNLAGECILMQMGAKKLADKPSGLIVVISPLNHRELAQLVERHPYKVDVVGSSPAFPTKII
jgi:hypothetical protein